MENDLDFKDWVQSHSGHMSIYGSTFPVDDRPYSREIRVHKDSNEIDWLVQSGRYDGKRGRFDAHCAGGKANSLSEFPQNIDDVIGRLPAPYNPFPTI